MSIKIKAMGDYQTNCYIITVDDKDIIIDPGVDATSWVKNNVKNPIAILNTHGHFDHIWSNKELSDLFNIQIYAPKDDAFMLEIDPFQMGMTPSKADVLVNPDQEFNLNGIKIKFHFFPGHTPGCSAIEIENNLFTGDFIFNGSIGRCDFPYSNPELMIESINKVLKWGKDIKIYPGHGPSTNLNKERNSLENWKNYL